MYSYLIGIITEINPSYIVLENNNIGYKINVAVQFCYTAAEKGGREIWANFRL